MLNDRIVYLELIKPIANIKSLMDRLPNDFTSVNMLLVSPTIGHNNLVDIRPYEKHKRLAKENIKLPDGAKMINRNPKGAIVEFSYAEGNYRVLERTLQF